MSPFVRFEHVIVRKLGKKTLLKRVPILPLAVLVAQKIYAQDDGDACAFKWSPVSAVVGVLAKAF